MKTKRIAVFDVITISGKMIARHVPLKMAVRLKHGRKGAVIKYCPADHAATYSTLAIS